MLNLLFYIIKVNFNLIDYSITNIWLNESNIQVIIYLLFNLHWAIFVWQFSVVWCDYYILLNFCLVRTIARPLMFASGLSSYEYNWCCENRF